MKFFISVGSDVNAKTKYAIVTVGDVIGWLILLFYSKNQSCLHYAIGGGHIKIVETLLQNGAKQGDFSGTTRFQLGAIFIYFFLSLSGANRSCKVSQTCRYCRVITKTQHVIKFFF